MITGYNTNVKHCGRVFHVQTEVIGKSRPKIESLIYICGRILDSIRFDCPVESTDTLDEEKIMHLMETRHQRVIWDIERGKYDSKSEIATDNSASVGVLNEVLSVFLDDSDSEETNESQGAMTGDSDPDSTGGMG